MTERDALIQKALEGLSTGIYTTIYHAAKVLGISEDTLVHRRKGGRSSANGQEVAQLLSSAKERALV